MTEKKVPEVRFKGFSDDWEQRKLGEVYTERKEKGNDRLPILSVSIHSGISDGELSSDSLGKEVKRSEDKTLYKHTYPGDLVFNMMRAWQGAIGVVKNEGMVSPAYIVAKPNKNLFPRFMNYYFQKESVISQMNNLSYGVTDFRKRLYWDSFIIGNTAFPSTSEQKKISDFLDNLSDTIALHQRKLKQLNTLKQGYLQQLFPKNGEKYPKVRFANFEGHWEQCKLGDLLKEFNTKSKIEDEHSVLSSTNNGMEVRNGRVSGTSNIGYKIVENGDLILSPQNLWLGNININSIGTGLVSPSYKTFKLVKVNTEFIGPQLRVPEMIEKYKNASTQGASVVRRNLELESFYQIMIQVPSIEEQQKDGTFFKILDDIITCQLKKIEKLNSIKKFYLKKIFI